MYGGLEALPSRDLSLSEPRLGHSELIQLTCSQRSFPLSFIVPRWPEPGGLSSLPTQCDVSAVSLLAAHSHHDQDF